MHSEGLRVEPFGGEPTSHRLTVFVRVPPETIGNTFFLLD